MISALAMWRAASAANRIISTAPMAKLGATNTLAFASRRSSSSDDVEARGPDDHVDAGADRLARVGQGGRRER